MVKNVFAQDSDAKVNWQPDINFNKYSRSVTLTPDENKVLAALLESGYRWGTNQTAMEKAYYQKALHRLLIPLRDVFALVEGEESSKDAAAAALLRACGREKTAYWGWDKLTWSRILGINQAQFYQINGTLVNGGTRHYMIAAAYLLGFFTDIRFLGSFKRLQLARKVFGFAAVEVSISTVKEVLFGWGYLSSKFEPLEATVCEALLLNRSPSLHDLSSEILFDFRQGASKFKYGYYLQISKALASLNIISAPLLRIEDPNTKRIAIRIAETGSIHQEWLYWTHKWEATSTLAPATRRHIRSCLYKVGRWLKVHHPDITQPQQWTRALSLEWVVAVDRMKVGEYVTYLKQLPRLGQPLLPRTKGDYLSAMRTFFRDCQEWEWIPRRFDPGRVFATPRSIKALIGPAPRIIADDVWARLLWAGINLTSEDLFSSTSRSYYPLELVKAMAVVWLIAGLRSDEIVRLRLGCLRWQQDQALQAKTITQEIVCLLDVPVNKTGCAFTKPVDPVVGRAIAKWEQVRPRQPSFLDTKTGEVVEFLFSYRACLLTREYINRTLIPTLCHKAQVPLKDVRGKITSHRARATIASQLFNSRKPMSLFELQAWLGHRSPITTQSYVAITPTKLAKAYADAGYLERNMRALEVLIDSDAVKSAAAASGGPWRYYDLGHCFCSYEFFDQCPHRMACVRCDFCIPKDSNHAQLLESKTNIIRLLQEMPLS